MDSDLRVSAGKGLFFLICWWVLLTVAGSLAVGAVGSESAARLRWAVVIQDLTVFILPVVLTMVIIAVRPLRYTELERVPAGVLVGQTVLIALLSVPAMNRIVAWNESLRLPGSMAAVEEVLRDSENAAQAMVERLMGGTTLLDLLLAILIMGVLTGIAEELFFRGGIQRLLMSKFGNAHVAIWSTAVIFSAVHLQFFGFFPRVLMGALFGYLMVWSGSLRLSMFAHALNNSLVVLNFWLINRGVIAPGLNEVGAQASTGSVVLCVVSAAATAAALRWMYVTALRR